ncbi:MAG: response regulator [Rhodospirillaceae bacterium]|nr:response regulator [Rhodospirillaceae bacterium]
MSDDSLQNMTVLLVDDENFSRKIVAGMLADMGRPSVLEAADGAEALVLLGETKVDLIISDFNMPHVHGLQLLRAVRAGTIEVSRATPFAMLTGYSEKRLVDLALALDCNGFLIKPVSKHGLVRRLNKMLSYVKSDNWLKSKSLYEGLEVDHMLDAITNPDGIKMMGDDEPLFMQSGREYNSGPVEVRGHGKKKKFDEKDFRKFRDPKSGRIEVRALENPYGRDLDEDKVASEISQMPALENQDDAKEVDDLSPNLDAPQVESRNADSAGLREFLCPVAEVPDHAHLTRDIYTANGRLFIHAGTRLTPLIVSILMDLNQMDHPVENIWIELEDD